MKSEFREEVQKWYAQTAFVVVVTDSHAGRRRFGPSYTEAELCLKRSTFPLALLLCMFIGWWSRGETVKIGDN